LRANRAVLPKFLFYYTLTDTFLNPLNELQRGTSYPAVRDGDVRVQPFPLAPLPEQERIVAKIEELFTLLETGTAALKRVRAGLKRYKASVLKAAVEGRLVAQNPEDEPAGNTLQHAWQRRDKKLPKLPFESDELPELPFGWSWASLEQLTDGSKYALKAGPFGSALKKEFYVPKGYKIYGQEQVIRGDPYYGDYYINDELFKKLRSCEVKPGDVLISLVGTIGKVLILPNDIEPGLINPRLVKITFDKDIVDSRYFKYYIESQTAKDHFSIASHGQTMDVLNLGILKELPIPLPPLAEQKRIADETEKRYSIAENLGNILEKLMARSARLRQSILKQAFEGRLVPQNPQDEPAEKLLERIKEAKKLEEAPKKAEPRKKKEKKMSTDKKQQPLYETLMAANGTRLTPEQLLKASGYETAFRREDNNQEVFDAFYEELRFEIQKGRIKEERPNNKDVYLIGVKS